MLIARNGRRITAIRIVLECCSSASAHVEVALPPGEARDERKTPWIMEVVVEALASCAAEASLPGRHVPVFAEIENVVCEMSP